MYRSSLKLNRHTLATQAMHAATATRVQAKLNQFRPICIYSLCETLGVTVRFNYINMEGMYQRSVPPRIHLSARRPLPRRTFNCAHELGHHVFGHGSSIDEIRDNVEQYSFKDPKEFLADAFAGFVLMPTVGLRRAFAVRGWNPESATPVQIYVIACDFGVGYSTILTHLSACVGMISSARSVKLNRTTPKTLRSEILDVQTQEPLVIVDQHYLTPTIDIEVRTLLLLPLGTEISDNKIVHERDLADGRLFRAVRSGIVQANIGRCAKGTFIRVSPEAYVGLASYRHLEDEPNE